MSMFFGPRAILIVGLFFVLRVQAGPVIESWATENGARVYFVNAPELAMFDVRVTFAAGSARDGDEKGVASLTNDLLKEGAGDLDANAFSAQLGATGAQLQMGALRDMAYLRLRTLADDQYAKPALALLEAAMARPRFDVDAIDRLKARAMIGFRHKQQSPATIAEETFYATVYLEHPYASSPDGNEKTVAALSRSNILAFHSQYYVARNMVIAVVGALDKTRAESIAAALSASLPDGAAAPALPGVAMTQATEKHN